MSPEDRRASGPLREVLRRKNYIALIGKKSPNLEEACGYYGEKIVLRAQQLGLNTCWVAMTYSKVKTAFQIAPGEKLCLVIAVGHGTTQGAGHPVKQPEEVSKADSPVPDWFQRGVRAALLAPTAMNQQKFTFTLQGGSVAAKAGTGFTPRWTWALPNTILKSGRGPRSSAGLPDREPVFRQPPASRPCQEDFDEYRNHTSPAGRHRSAPRREGADHGRGCDPGPGHVRPV
ncbi:MAG: nitroreductase family protein [Dysosmobacter welbionis]